MDFGVGPAFPHVEVRRAPAPASRCLATTSSASRPTTPELKGGGSLETDIWTNHVTFGVSYHFGGAPTVAAPY